MSRYSTRKIIDDKENRLRIKETKLKFPQKTNVRKRLTDHKKKMTGKKKTPPSTTQTKTNKKKEK